MFNLYRITQCIHRKYNVIFTFVRRTPVPNKLYSSKPFDVNTNVVKDVILYKYENPRFFKYIQFFAICQFGFWFYLSQLAYTTLRDAPVEKSETLPWWRNINLGENKYKNTISALCFIVGYGILVGGWCYTSRSVRYLVLRKGGGEITFVTYMPIGKNRMITVPLTDISCQQSRQLAKSQLPIKIKNRFLHYLLDMKGEFRNTELFDYTAGLKRNLK